MEPPSFPAGGLQTVRAAPGSVATLTLPTPAGTPPLHYSWSRAGASLDDRFVSTEEAGGVRLTVSTARTGDTGVYTLQASNAAGSDTARVRLEVSAEESPSGEDPPTFLRRLQDLTVKVGTRTRFLVEIISSTECKVTWYRNERRLLEAERVSIVRDGSFFCADVAAVSVDDAGRWTCTAENVGGRASCSAHLNVLVPKAYKRPEFVEELRALLTEQGTVSLECKVVGVPTPVLRWFKDSREIKAGDVFALTANAEDPTSLGTYTCEAVNCMGRAYSSSKVHVVGRASREGSLKPNSSGLSPEPPPIFTRELEDQYVRICEPFTLSCQIVVPPWPRSVVWYNKEGKVEAGERYHVLEDGVGGYVLEVRSAEWRDEGEWKCVATSSGGRVGISTCSLNMDVPKNYRKPRFMENLQAVLTEEGLVSFECKVVGFPTPVLSWFKDGQELKPGDVYQLTGTNSLGSYCCIAKNCMGQASSSAELTVEDIQNQLNEEEKLQLFSKNQAPKFVHGLKSVEAKIDEPFRFTIKVAIPPEPSLLWYRDDQPVDESSRCHLGKEERGVFFLDIQALEFLDQAEWKCVAFNDFGQSVTSCFLKLIIPRHYKKPRFLENLQAILSDEGAVNLECKVIGVPQPVLKWYKDGEELKPGDIHRIISGQDGTCSLGTYTCEASNCMGVAASSASLLGFEESMKAKEKKKAEEQALQRNLSLSTIHEERTSQMYDTPVGDITLDDKGEVSFSFDGKEVSVSLYETPDLTEEEALQIVEMYADQLSENVTEHNVVELPPLRFVKETSTSGNLLMEALVIDVSPEYFASPEEDLRTEADVEDISIADENGLPQLSLDQEIDIAGEDYLEKTMALLSEEKVDIPLTLGRKKSDSQKSGEDYFSLSREQSLSEEKKDDDTQVMSESELQSFASAHSSGKPKSKSSKPSGEDGHESSDLTKTILLRDDMQKPTESDVKTSARKTKRERRSSRGSSGSEKSVDKFKDELIKEQTIIATETEMEGKQVMTNEEFRVSMTNVSTSLNKVINDIEKIEKEIIIKSELMASAATASKSLEIISSLINPLSEILSITDTIQESASETIEVQRTLFSRLPKPLKVLQQTLTIIEKCIDVESDNRTLVKKTCVSIMEKCGNAIQNLVSEINAIEKKEYLLLSENVCNELDVVSNEISTVVNFSTESIKTNNLLNETTEVKLESTVESKHLTDTQKALFELKGPLRSLLYIVDSAESGKIVDISQVNNSEVILNDMSASIQDLQSALEQIESLSVLECATSLNKYNTEIIENVMEPVLQLRSSFEKMSTEIKAEDKIQLNKVLSSIKENLTVISSYINKVENNIGAFDVLQNENKLEALQKMAETLISLEKNLPTLDTMPQVQGNMNSFHKNLTKALEKVIESNNANKYLSMIEICDGIRRINSCIRDMDTDNILSLASLSNTLKIIQNQFIKNIFDSELNCCVVTNITDILIGIQETINQAQEFTTEIQYDNFQDTQAPIFDSTKVEIIVEHVNQTVAAINQVKLLETTSSLKENITPTLQKICPILEELKQNIASACVGGIQKEAYVSDISEKSFSEKFAVPLSELNHNVIVLNQTIIENIESLKESNEIVTAIAEPLQELFRTLEVIQQDVISQFGPDLSPYEISVDIASIIQSLQSCVVMIQDHAAIEVVDDMSTLEDISGIKTTAETASADQLVLPTAEFATTEQTLGSFYDEQPKSSIAQALHVLNEHLTILQSPEIIDAIDTLSEISDYSSLKSVTLGLSDLHSGIEEVLQPIVLEGLQSINASKLAAMAEPMQVLQHSLSVVDPNNIPIYENILELLTDNIHSVLNKINAFKEHLDKCMQAILPALEFTKQSIEISSSVNKLREACQHLKIMLKSINQSSTTQIPEVQVLDDVVNEILIATDVTEGIKIEQVRYLSEELYARVAGVREEILRFTPNSSEALPNEASFIHTIEEVEHNIAVLEEYDFVDLSRASELSSCASPQIAKEVEIESLVHISEIVETAVRIIKDAGEDTPMADLMIVEDFFTTCKNEFTILRCLLNKSMSPKKIIRLVQEFCNIQSTIQGFKTKTNELQLSDDVNQCIESFLIHSDDCLATVRQSLIKIVESQSELLFKSPIVNLKYLSHRNHFDKMANLVAKLDDFVDAVKPNAENIKDKIIMELKNLDLCNVNNEENKLVRTMDDFFRFVEDEIVVQEDNDKKVILKKILTCLEKHQDYKDATDAGKVLIIMHCLSNCVDILQESLGETKQKIECDTNDEALDIKAALMEMVEPLQNLHTQLIHVQEVVLSGVQEDSISLDIDSAESIVQTISDVHKKISAKLELETVNVSDKDVALIFEVDKDLHAIQDSIKALKNQPAAQDIKDVTKQIQDVEKSLHVLVASENVITDVKDKIPKGSTEQLVQHINQYIELIEIVEEISAVIEIEDLKETIEMAKDLRETFVTSDMINDEVAESIKEEILIEQARLAHKLQKAISALQVQVFDSAQEMVPELSTEIFQRVARVTAQLQADLMAVTGVHITIQAPPYVLDEVAKSLETISTENRLVPESAQGDKLVSIVENVNMFENTADPPIQPKPKELSNITVEPEEVNITQLLEDVSSNERVINENLVTVTQEVAVAQMETNMDIAGVTKKTQDGLIKDDIKSFSISEEAQSIFEQGSPEVYNVLNAEELASNQTFSADSASNNMPDNELDIVEPVLVCSVPASSLDDLEGSVNPKTGLVTDEKIDLQKVDVTIEMPEIAQLDKCQPFYAKLVEHLDEYVNENIIEIVDEFSCSANLHELMQSVDLAKQLQKSITISESVIEPNIETEPNPQSPVYLASQLKMALLVLYNQELESLEVMAPHLTKDKLKVISEIVHNLCDDLTQVMEAVQSNQNTSESSVKESVQKANVVEQDLNSPEEIDEIFETKTPLQEVGTAQNIVSLEETSTDLLSEEKHETIDTAEIKSVVGKITDNLFSIEAAQSIEVKEDFSDVKSTDLRVTDSVTEVLESSDVRVIENVSSNTSCDTIDLPLNEDNYSIQTAHSTEVEPERLDSSVILGGISLKQVPDVMNLEMEEEEAFETLAGTTHETTENLMGENVCPIKNDEVNIEIIDTLISKEDNADIEQLKKNQPTSLESDDVPTNINLLVDDSLLEIDKAVKSTEALKNIPQRDLAENEQQLGEDTTGSKQKVVELPDTIDDVSQDMIVEHLPTSEVKLLEGQLLAAEENTLSEALKSSLVTVQKTTETPLDDTSVDLVKIAGEPEIKSKLVEELQTIADSKSQKMIEESTTRETVESPLITTGKTTETPNDITSMNVGETEKQRKESITELNQKSSDFTKSQSIVSDVSQEILVEHLISDEIKFTKEQQLAKEDLTAEVNLPLVTGHETIQTLNSNLENEMCESLKIEQAVSAETTESTVESQRVASEVILELVSEQLKKDQAESSNSQTAENIVREIVVTSEITALETLGLPLERSGNDGDLVELLSIETKQITVEPRATTYEVVAEQQVVPSGQQPVEAIDSMKKEPLDAMEILLTGAATSLLVTKNEIKEAKSDNTAEITKVEDEIAAEAEKEMVPKVICETTQDMAREQIEVEEVVDVKLLPSTIDQITYDNVVESLICTPLKTISNTLAENITSDVNSTVTNQEKLLKTEQVTVEMQLTENVKCEELCSKQLNNDQLEHLSTQPLVVENIPQTIAVESLTVATIDCTENLARDVNDVEDFEAASSIELNQETMQSQGIVCEIIEENLDKQIKSGEDSSLETFKYFQSTDAPVREAVESTVVSAIETTCELDENVQNDIVETVNIEEESSTKARRVIMESQGVVSEISDELCTEQLAIDETPESSLKTVLESYEILKDGNSSDVVEDKCQTVICEITEETVVEQLNEYQAPDLELKSAAAENVPTEAINSLVVTVLETTEIFTGDISNDASDSLTIQNIPSMSNLQIESAFETDLKQNQVNENFAAENVVSSEQQAPITAVEETLNTTDNVMSNIPTDDAPKPSALIACEEQYYVQITEPVVIDKTEPIEEFGSRIEAISPEDTGNEVILRESFDNAEVVEIVSVEAVSENAMVPYFELESADMLSSPDVLDSVEDKLASASEINDQSFLIVHLEQFIFDEVSDVVQQISDLTNVEELKEILHTAKELHECLVKSENALAAESVPLQNVKTHKSLLQKKLQEGLCILHNVTLERAQTLTSEIKSDNLQKLSEVITYLQKDLEAVSSEVGSEEVSENVRTSETDSMKRLKNLLQDVSDETNVLLSEKSHENNEKLRDTLDEVQTVIIKLKRDYDCSAVDTLNETLEDLECSVRSVQLQINEESPPELLQEACATLNLLVNNMNESKVSLLNESSTIKEIKDHQILKKCSEDVNQTVELLEDVSTIKAPEKGNLHKIVSELGKLKDKIKVLRITFLIDAETLVERGIDALRSLDEVEEKVFTLEKDIESEINIPTDIRENIWTAVHSVYGSISNMRGTISSIQKQYMFENYGKPTDNLLKSIKNTRIISEIDSEDNQTKWKRFSKTLRNVLNHFEDIKFYISLDKTARLPSDAAFTKIILEDLKNNINEIIIDHEKLASCNNKEKMSGALDIVTKYLKKIEIQTSLEVKEKIPMFCEIAPQVLQATELVLAKFTKCIDQESNEVEIKDNTLQLKNDQTVRNMSVSKEDEFFTEAIEMETITEQKQTDQTNELVKENIQETSQTDSKDLDVTIEKFGNEEVGAKDRKKSFSLTALDEQSEEQFPKLDKSSDKNQNQEATTSYADMTEIKEQKAKPTDEEIQNEDGHYLVKENKKQNKADTEIGKVEKQNKQEVDFVKDQIEMELNEKNASAIEEKTETTILPVKLEQEQVDERELANKEEENRKLEVSTARKKAEADSKKIQEEQGNKSNEENSYTAKEKTKQDQKITEFKEEEKQEIPEVADDNKPNAENILLVKRTIKDDNNKTELGEDQQKGETAHLIKEKAKADKKRAELEDEEKPGEEVSLIAKEKEEADKKRAELDEQEKRSEEEARLAKEKAEADKKRLELAEQEKRTEEESRLTKDKSEADKKQVELEEQKKGSEEESLLAKEKAKADEKRVELEKLEIPNEEESPLANEKAEVEKKRAELEEQEKRSEEEYRLAKEKAEAGKKKLELEEQEKSKEEESLRANEKVEADKKREELDLEEKRKEEEAHLATEKTEEDKKKAKLEKTKKKKGEQSRLAKEKVETDQKRTEVEDEEKRIEEKARLVKEKAEADKKSLELEEQKKRSEEESRLTKEKSEADKKQVELEEQKKGSEEKSLLTTKKAEADEKRVELEKQEKLSEEEARLAKEKAEADKKRLELEEQEKLSEEESRLAKEKAEADKKRVELEKQEKLIEEEARLAKEKAEADKKRLEQEEQEKRSEEESRLAKEKAEADKKRVELEKQEKLSEEEARLAKEKVEADKKRLELEEQEKISEEESRLAKEKAEADKKRVELEKQEKLIEEEARLAKEKAEADKKRLEQEEQEKRSEEESRLAKEKAEADKKRIELEKQEKLSEEESRLVKEKAEADKKRIELEEQEKRSKEEARLGKEKAKADKKRLELEEQEKRSEEESRLAKEKAEADKKRVELEEQEKRSKEEARLAKENAEADKKRLELEEQEKRNKEEARLAKEKAKADKKKANLEKTKKKKVEQTPLAKEKVETDPKRTEVEDEEKSTEEEARLAKEKTIADKKRLELEQQEKRNEEESRLAKEKAEADKKRVELEEQEKRNEEEARLVKEKAEADKKRLELEEQEKRNEEEARLAKEKAEADKKRLELEEQEKRSEEESRLAKEKAEADKKRVESEEQEKRSEEEASLAKEKAKPDKKRLELEEQEKRNEEEARLAKEKAETDKKRVKLEKQEKLFEEEARLAKEKAEADKKRLELEEQEKRSKEEARLAKEKAEADKKKLELEEQEKRSEEESRLVKEKAEADKKRIELEEQEKRSKEEARLGKEKAKADKKRLELEEQEKRSEEESRLAKEKAEADKKKANLEKTKKKKGEQTPLAKEKVETDQKRTEVEDEEKRKEEESRLSRGKAEIGKKQAELEEEVKRTDEEALIAKARTEEDQKKPRADKIKVGKDDKAQLAKENVEADKKRRKSGFEDKYRGQEAGNAKEKAEADKKKAEVKDGEKYKEEEAPLANQKAEMDEKENKTDNEIKGSENVAQQIKENYEMDKEKTKIGMVTKRNDDKAYISMENMEAARKSELGEKIQSHLGYEKVRKVESKEQIENDETRFKLSIDNQDNTVLDYDNVMYQESKYGAIKKNAHKTDRNGDVKRKYEASYNQEKNSSRFNDNEHYIKEYQYEPGPSHTKSNDWDKHRFVDHSHRDFSMEFAKPSKYRERSFENRYCVDKDYSSLNKNATIYKAQTINLDAQLRSSVPPLPLESSRSSEPTERRPDMRHRSKAFSEARSVISEKRTLSRNSTRKPVFSTFLTDRTAVEGSRVKLTCSVISSSDPTVTWYRNGVLLDNKLKYRKKLVDGLITLEVLNAVPSDSAEYSCTVENENGAISTSANLKVYPSFEASPIPPTFTRSIRDTFHLAENELVLECRIRGQPLPKITWFKDDKQIPSDGRYQAFYLADGVCRLAIDNPTPEDSGTYTCKAENSVWTDQITHFVNFTGRESQVSPNVVTAEKTRIARQSLESRRPHFGNVLTDYQVARGGTIGLQVEIRGCPTRVEWLREGRSVTEVYRNARVFVEQGLYTLALSDVTETESGLYTCRAWSAHGNVDMNAAITVVQPSDLDGKPAVIVGRPEKDILISVGEDINISFRTQGEPKPKVIFMKGIRDITNSQRVCKMTSDDYVKFTLKRSVVSDAGTYCILVRNAYGCDRAFVTVVVRQRASSEHLISDWTYPLDDSALSIADRKYKSVPERIPGEPCVVDGGNNWVSLAWPKSDPQTTAPVLAYKVESWLIGAEGGARWVELGITPLNSFDAFNLKQGEEYHFRVTPRNRYGWGESSQTSSSIGVGLAGDRPEFVDILPGQLKILAGETANLTCSVKGKPVPGVVWMKNGHEVEEEAGRMTSQFNGFDCCLTIKDINIDDEGRYSCEATNTHGKASTYARLAVVTDRTVWEADAKLKRERSAEVEGDYPPQFTMRLRDRRVQATYPVRLTCQVIGSPPPKVSWYKDGEEVVYDKRRNKYQDEQFHTLEIAPTNLDDGGVYEVTARNNSGAVSCHCGLVVDKGIRAYVAPEFCCGLEPLYKLHEGDELRISAVVEAYPSVGVTWYRDGVRLRPSRRAIMTLDRDGQIELALAAVTTRDAGVYTCTASNEVGRASTSGKVEVIGTDQTSEPRIPPVVISPDVPYSKEPMFIRKPRSSEAREGDTVIIECEVVGDPKPDVYWLRDFLKPDYYRDATHFKRVGDGPEYRFEIPHAKLNYTGAYSVVARNVHGEAKAVISLQIKVKDISSTEEAHHIRYGRVEVLPRFERNLTDMLSCDGDTVEFECQVTGNPDPDIRWFHYAEVIRDCADFESSYDDGTARLKIKQVTAEDEGTYTCEASNCLGKAKSNACLVVYPPGEPNTLCQRLRRPPALLSAASTPRSTPRSTPARSVSRTRTPGPDTRRLSSPGRQMAPTFYTYPFNKVVEEGENVTFKCAVKGNPSPWASWDKDGSIITPSARITVKEKEEIMRILEIDEVSIEDVGIYRITVENELGRAEASARLEVITRSGKFYGGLRAYSASPRKCLSYRRRPSTPRQD
uniref:Titin homolog n=1 Tax=Bombyx mori TaxID=7091 RepID=A0A8R2R242_BOMMO|nr:titin homolog isoform X4 [Bombyx mori]